MTPLDRVDCPTRHEGSCCNGVQARRHGRAPGDQGPRAALRKRKALPEVKAQLNGPHGVRHRAARGRSVKELPSSASVQPLALWGGKVRARARLEACRCVHPVERKGRGVEGARLLALCAYVCVCVCARVRSLDAWTAGC